MHLCPERVSRASTSARGHRYCLLITLSPLSMRVYLDIKFDVLGIPLPVFLILEYYCFGTGFADSLLDRLATAGLLGGPRCPVRSCCILIGLQCCN
jgi:hypothetical protein